MTFLPNPYSSLLVALVAVSPVASLWRNGLSSVVFYLLVLFGVLAWCRRGGAIMRAIPAGAPGLRPLAIGGAVFVAVTVLLLYVQDGSLGAEFEKSVRFSLTALLTLLFLGVPSYRLQAVQWGMMLTVLFMTGQLLFLAGMFDGRPDTTMLSRYNAVGYGNLLLLFSVLLAYSCGWRVTRWARAERGLKILVASVGFVGFLMSETRTGWLAMPAFALIGLYLLRGQSWRVPALLLGGFVGVTALGFTVNPVLQERASLAVTELRECNGHADTSVCIRVQLLHASWLMFRENPLTGVGGRDAFQQQLQELSRKGLVTERVASDFGEPHNDLLYYLATYGLLVFLAALGFIYLLPIWYFARLLGRNSGPAQVAAAMGLAWCVGFAAFGMTEMMFRGMRTASLYAIWVAVLLALALQPGRQGPPPGGSGQA
ncbi:O-antigen ligase family protein [Orrella sp. JC864]|uniref:O-antigen ligase family protein n=1 Tax=Orrella sp. JC864 TaxID=3120298 RepID=UPI0012BCBBE0